MSRTQELKSSTPKPSGDHFSIFMSCGADDGIDADLKKKFIKDIQVSIGSDLSPETKLATARLCLYLLTKSSSAAESEFYRLSFAKLLDLDFTSKTNDLASCFEIMTQISENFSYSEAANEELALLHIYLFFHERESMFGDDKNFARSTEFATKIQKLLLGLKTTRVYETFVDYAIHYLISNIECSSTFRDDPLNILLTAAQFPSLRLKAEVCKYLMLIMNNEPSDEYLKQLSITIPPLAISQSLEKLAESILQRITKKQTITLLLKAISFADPNDKERLKSLCAKLVSYYAKLYQKDQKSIKSEINLQDDKGMTLLHHLIWHQVTSVPLSRESDNLSQAIIHLLTQGANVNIPNQEGNTAMHLAAKDGSVALLKTLVCPQANLRIKNKNGKTPLGFFELLKHSDRDRECYRLLIAHRNQYQPITEGEREDAAGEIGRMRRRKKAYAINLSEEKLNIFPASMDYWLHQNLTCLPFTSNCIIQFLQKIEKMLSHDSKEIIYKKKIVNKEKKEEENIELNFSKGLTKLVGTLLYARKKKAKDHEFELALDCLYTTIRDQVDFHLYCASRNKNLEGGAWLSKNALLQQKITHVLGIGPMTKGQREDNYSFTWLSGEYQDQIIEDAAEPIILKFNARKAQQHAHILVRDEDKTAYIDEGYLCRYQFGRVIYSKRVYTSSGKPVKVIEVIGPNGKKTHTTPELTEIATEKTINDVMALDVIEMVRQVYEADPSSAKEMIKEFYDSKSHDKDSTNKDSGTLQQQRIKKARELSGLINKYEASIVTKLPFQAKLSSSSEALDKKCADSSIVSKKEETLIEEVYVISKPEIKSLFDAIAAGDVSQVEAVLKENRERSKQPYPKCPSAYMVQNPFLIDSHFKCDDKKINGVTTPLIYAIRKKQKKIIEVLLANGANVHKRENNTDINRGRAYGCDALMAAAEIGDLDTIKLLVENHHANLAALRDVSVDLDKNANALSLALKNKHFDVVRYLVPKGARLPNQINEYKPAPALSCALVNPPKVEVYVFTPPESQDEKKQEQYSSLAAVLNCHGKLLIGKEGKKFRVTSRKIMKPKVELKEKESDKGYILSVLGDYSIEKDVSNGCVKPLKGAQWAIYKEIEIDDVELEPWTKIEAKSFAENILVDKKWKLEKEGQFETYDVDKDPKAVLVMKITKDAYTYINGADKIKEILLKIKDGKEIEGVPLLYYAPSLLKIKLLAKTTLSEVYSQLPSINGPETLVLAACNSVDATSPEVKLDTTTKTSLPLVEIPIYSDIPVNSVVPQTSTTLAVTTVDPLSIDAIKLVEGWLKQAIPSFRKACKDGQLDQVKLLLDNLEKIFRGKNTTYFQTFITHIDIDQSSALNLASKEGHLDVVKLLLANAEEAFGSKNTKGFQNFLNQRNKDHLSPFNNACQKGHLAVGQFLIATAKEAFGGEDTDGFRDFMSHPKKDPVVEVKQHTSSTVKAVTTHKESSDPMDAIYDDIPQTSATAKKATHPVDDMDDIYDDITPSRKIDGTALAQTRGNAMHSIFQPTSITACNPIDGHPELSTNKIT